MKFKINFIKYSKQPYFITDEQGHTHYNVTKNLFGNYKFLQNNETKYSINKGMVTGIYNIHTPDRKHFSNILEVDVKGPDYYEFLSKEGKFCITEPEKNKFRMTKDDELIATAVYDKYYTKDFTVETLYDQYNELILLFFVARHIDD